MAPALELDVIEITPLDGYGYVAVPSLPSQIVPAVTSPSVAPNLLIEL